MIAESRICGNITDAAVSLILKRNGQIRLRNKRLCLGCPLGRHDSAGSVVLTETGFLKLNGVFKTVEVKMIDRKAVDFIGLQ